ncbi:uracil phosphoribosyltransferase homolog [Dendronephthya gigantea]|uniref:uracil phosphoribosyltransferase homolog n=1 Tax=Dendronephthya gigantea TaxID=151771 RepID=UPI00106B5AF4|nr:uracil phosphoribosyltransferase homolog [Dendronephthya gigantea]
MAVNGYISENNTCSKIEEDKHLISKKVCWKLYAGCQDCSLNGSVELIPQFEDFGPRLIRIRMNDQIRELQTILRDPQTDRGDFVFYADRLIRLVVEEGLNQLPYEEVVVTTPTGGKYNGLKFKKGNCGVSIMRSGEAMEKGLRDCCRSIRIGKILIQSETTTSKPQVYYAKFPFDVDKRQILLMYPLLNTGATIIEAVKVLAEHGVKEENIIFLNLFATPHGVKNILNRFTKLRILTSEISQDIVLNFGRKYFGTE